MAQDESWEIQLAIAYNDGKPLAPYSLLREADTPRPLVK